MAGWSDRCAGVLDVVWVGREGITGPELSVLLLTLTSRAESAGFQMCWGLRMQAEKFRCKAFRTRFDTETGVRGRVAYQGK